MKLQKPKRGRPPKAPAERKRNNLTIRMRDALRDDLAKSAVINQRSLSEEAETRLEQSFQNQRLMIDAMVLAFGRRAAGVLISIGGAIGGTAATVEVNTAGQVNREDWADIPFVYDQVARSVTAILDGLRPAGAIGVPRGPTAAAQAILDDVGRIIAADGLLSLTRKKVGPDSPVLLVAARELLGSIVDRIAPENEEAVMRRAAKRSRGDVSSKA